MAKTSQACLRCRALKSRCVPTSASRTCARCLKAGKPCQWSEQGLSASSTRRKGRSRIGQVEEKIDRLFSHFVNGAAAEAHDSTYGVPSEGQSDALFAPTPASLTAIIAEGRAVYDPSDATHENEAIRLMHELAQAHEFQAARPSEVRPRDKTGLTSSLLATEDCQVLLTEYRRMAYSFPFVLIPDVPAREMAASKPMLLLACIVVGSWRDRSRQCRLVQLFRRQLSLRTLLQPSLTDFTLLQSLLVYVGWSHLYLDLKLHTVIMTAHMLAAMTINLKLMPRNKMLPRADSNRSASQEEQRAVLGCYYICSVIANGMSGYQFLPHCTPIQQYSYSLRADPASDGDKMAASLVRFQHLDDRAKQQLDSRIYHDYDSLLMDIEQVRQDSKTIQSEHLQRIVELRGLAVESRLCQLRISQIQNAPGADSLCQEYTRLVNVGRSFLDKLMLFETESLPLLAYTEWFVLPRILVILITSTTPDAASPPAWDYKEAAEKLRLHLYIESLCHRMAGLSQWKASSHAQPDFWAVMKLTLMSVRSWYERKAKQDKYEDPSKLTGEVTEECIQDGTNEPAARGSDNITGYCPMLSPWMSDNDFMMFLDTQELYDFDTQYS